MNESPKSSGSSPKFQIPSMTDLTQPELYSRLEDLEQIRSDLLEEIDRTKARARLLLAKKEISERRLKHIIFKLEAFLICEI
jgi:hypothetical protein